MGLMYRLSVFCVPPAMRTDNNCSLTAFSDKRFDLFSIQNFIFLLHRSSMTASDGRKTRPRAQTLLPLPASYIMMHFIVCGKKEI